MGAAIGVFEGAAALRVPRSRFLPVKTTSRPARPALATPTRCDDAYRVALAEGRDAAPLVSLSDEFKLLRDFDARFPDGPPSLVEAERLTVEGDVTFEGGVAVRGTARVDGPATVRSGEVLS